VTIIFDLPILKQINQALCHPKNRYVAISSFGLAIYVTRVELKAKGYEKK